MIESTYPIDADGHGGFFAGYTAALHDAVTDFIVENPELIQLLDELFDESVSQYK